MIRVEIFPQVTVLESWNTAGLWQWLQVEGILSLLGCGIALTLKVTLGGWNAIFRAISQTRSPAVPATLCSLGYSPAQGQGAEGGMYQQLQWPFPRVWYLQQGYWSAGGWCVTLGDLGTQPRGTSFFSLLRVALYLGTV